MGSLGPFRIGSYDEDLGLYPVLAERCIYTLAYFNLREDAEQYVAFLETLPK